MAIASKRLTFSYYTTISARGTYTWYKPYGAKAIKVQLWGAGGGGSNGIALSQGIGGGGGHCALRYFDADYISATVQIILGAGGVGGPAHSSIETMGTNGGDSTFGAWLTAYGGGGSVGGVRRVGGYGAGGGGLLLPSVGNSGVSIAEWRYGVGSQSPGWYGSSNANFGLGSEYGGGQGGHGGQDDYKTGGSSLYGGCGGGAGGDTITGPPISGYAGGAGGQRGPLGTGDALNGGTNAAGGAGTDLWCGGGGGSGRVSGTAGTGYDGGKGGYASGGGGGGAGSAANQGGKGGDGGDGYLIITVY